MQTRATRQSKEAYHALDAVRVPATLAAAGDAPQAAPAECLFGGPCIPGCTRAAGAGAAGADPASGVDVRSGQSQVDTS